VSTRATLIPLSLALLLPAGFGVHAQEHASATSVSATAPPPPAAPLQAITLAGDATRGETLAYTCSGCHGVDSAVNAYPTYHVPKLGGQNADYLEIALQGYRAGTRSHDTMHGQGSQLSDQDIADIAAYFASIEGEAATGILSAGDDAIAAGGEKSTVCQACHGATGIAGSPQWPNLAGQHYSYLVEALKQYQSGERRDGIMGPLVSQLDAEAIGQIAAFYAAQPGLFQTPR
jgi:cytochrome c553